MAFHNFTCNHGAILAQKQKKRLPVDSGSVCLANILKSRAF